MTVFQETSGNSAAAGHFGWNRGYFCALGALAILWSIAYAGILPFSTWLAFTVFGLSKGSQIGASLEFFIYDTVKILLLLVALIYGLAWIRASL